MTKKGAWVYATGGEGQVFLGASNSRLYAVKLTNLRRGGRVRGGTATIRRLTALLVAIEKRYPDAVQTSATANPMEVRARRAGPVVVTIWPLRPIGPTVGAMQ